jgi:subtilisin family serine protease
MSAAYKLILLLFIGFIVSCAPRREKMHLPAPGSKCETRTILNEYLIKKKGQALERQHLTMHEVEKTVTDPSVDYMEPNYQISNNEFNSLKNPRTLSISPNANRIHAQYAWNRGFLGQGIRVSIVDSGVDVNQPLLQGALEDHWNFIDNSPDVFDESGHGTEIAGIIASAHNSWFGGIAPAATLVIADFMSSNRGDEFNAIRAIEYSIERGAKIINNSWSSQCSVSLRTSFQNWQNLDVIFVNAAGNDGENIDDTEIYPSNLGLKNTVTVGSVNSNFEKSKFSNYGNNVVVYAPGENVYSLSPGNIPFGPAFRSGTSIATPFVTGGLALAWGAHPHLSAANIVGALNSIAKDSKLRWPIFDIQALMEELDKVEGQLIPLRGTPSASLSESTTAL